MVGESSWLRWTSPNAEQRVCQMVMQELTPVFNGDQVCSVRYVIKQLTSLRSPICKRRTSSCFKRRSARNFPGRRPMSQQSSSAMMFVSCYAIVAQSLTPPQVMRKTYFIKKSMQRLSQCQSQYKSSQKRTADISPSQR